MLFSGTEVVAYSKGERVNSLLTLSTLCTLSIVNYVERALLSLAPVFVSVSVRVRAHSSWFF